MVKRIVDTAFWTDMSVIDNYSVEDKYFSLYLMTNGKTTQVGIYSLPKKVISFETGYTSDVIQVLLDRFSKQYGKIIYSEETQEITVLHSLQYTILKGGKPVSDLMERELARIKDGLLIASTYEEMKVFWNMSKRAFDKTIKQLFENELTNRGLMFPKNDIEKQNENQNQNQNEKQNDNHNDNHNHNHNEESGATNRSQEIDEDELAMINQYITYLKLTHTNVKEVLTPDNIIRVYYKELIGPLNPSTEHQLNLWKKEWPISLILEALHRSLNANSPMKYTASILSNWKKEGIKTYKDVINSERHYKH